MDTVFIHLKLVFADKHRIAVYPQETQKIMAYLKSSAKRSIGQN